MKRIVFIFCFLTTFFSWSQKLEPFKIFSANGKVISNKKFLKKISEADVILFGEFHDNSTAHWLQVKILKELHKNKNIVVGMEMLESDNQIAVNQYLDNKIMYEQLDSLARLWSNFKTDYKPIVEYCKENKLPVIASNIPRRYASLLFKQGEDVLMTLPETDKQWFPSLPMPYNENLKSYKAMLKMFGDTTHTNQNFPKSQAIKDYTMASNIVKNYVPNSVFLHINGSYHSDNYEGINWYLTRLNPNLKVLTISTVLQSNLNKLDSKNKNIANYIIVTDFDTIRTY